MDSPRSSDDRIAYPTPPPHPQLSSPYSGRASFGGANVEALLATLLWMTLAMAFGGVVAALVTAVRSDGRAAWLLLPFAGLAIHELLGAPLRGPFDLDVAAFRAAALVLVAVGSFAALLALARVARERNLAEELHWDAMETLRAVNEVPLAPGEKALDELLAIGARHFNLPFGAVLRSDTELPVAIHFSKGTSIDRASADRVLAQFSEWSADRPIVDDVPDPGLPLPLTRVFATSLQRDQKRIGLLFFASVLPVTRALTATDKDLLSLLATRAALAVERDASIPAVRSDVRPLPSIARPIEIPAPPIAVTTAPAAVSPAAASLADQLRAGLGAETAAFALDPELEALHTPSTSLEEVAHSLASGARLLCAEGTLRVEAGTTQSRQGQTEFLTLTVYIADERIDASALNGASQRGNTSIEALGERLRAHGGDVSMSVEAGVGASMTAYVPVEPQASEPDSVPSRTPRHASS